MVSTRDRSPEGGLDLIAYILQHQPVVPANSFLHRRKIVSQAVDDLFRTAGFDVWRKVTKVRDDHRRLGPFAVQGYAAGKYLIPYLRCHIFPEQILYATLFCLLPVTVNDEFSCTRADVSRYEGHPQQYDAFEGEEE